MLDQLQEQERLREERKRVRADMLAERLRDGRDASLDTADGAFRQIWRAISWRPERMRHRLLLGIPGLAVLALRTSSPTSTAHRPSSPSSLPASSPSRSRC